MYRYPRVSGPGAVLANKSFYKADTVQMKWNDKGKYWKLIWPLTCFGLCGLFCNDVKIDHNYVGVLIYSLK